MSSSTSYISLPIRANVSGKLKQTATSPQFTDLPAEIRLLIWEYLFPGPRTVRLIHTRGLLPCGCYGTVFWSRAPIPVLLHINHETCELAQKHYSLSFGTCASWGRVYFNFELDALGLPYYVQDVPFWEQLQPAYRPDVRRVQRFAVHGSSHATMRDVALCLDCFSRAKCER